MTEVLRIAVDDGVAYLAWAGDVTRSVRLSGKLRREARAGRGPRPVVGDYVEVDSDGTIVAMEPRRTVLARRAAGAGDVEQVIAANVDVAFVATAVGVDVNERRLERYLAVVHHGGVEPVVLLTKVDLCADVEAELARVRGVAGDVEVIAVSTRTGQGLDDIRARIGPGRTAALLGSSGVGKSTLVNLLVSEARQLTAELKDDGTGRHTTTRRQLFPLPSGGLLLDTPGMREVGLLDVNEGLAEAFTDVTELAEHCRYSDCSHSNEPGCALREGLGTGTLSQERFDAWNRLRAEMNVKKPRRR